MVSNPEPQAGQQRSAPAVADDQEEVLAFLADPSTHGNDLSVVRIDTHAAIVFLCGPDAYKVKRAVKFPFMDFSTLEQRRAACEAEVTINREYAPQLYVGTIPITRDESRLNLGGDGQVVEWVVHLRRFDENQTFDQLAARCELSPEIIAQTAEVILGTYAKAKVRTGDSATAALKNTIDETASALSNMPEMIPSDRAASMGAAMRTAFKDARPLLTSRAKKGRVRRCHGDLHLRNIVRLETGPTLFDAIEFDEELATVDILYDFAFLLMDLWTRGFPSQANLLLNRYLWGSPELPEELEGLKALPLFLSLRAAIRAKVSGLRCLHTGHSGEAKREAVQYLDAALSLLRPAPVSIIAIGGLSGTGKSTLAAGIAPLIGRPPGAVHIRSDIERKRLFGAKEVQRLPDEAYRSEVSGVVYRSIRKQAERAVLAGHSVVLDAVHRDLADRAAIRAVAESTGAQFVGLWLDAPIPVLSRRVSERVDDASDATAAVVQHQAESLAGDIEWPRLDASGSRESVVAAAVAFCEEALTHQN